MLGEFVRLVDLLVKYRAENRTTRRDRLAKELFDVYRDLGDVITCGREILFKLGHTRNTSLGISIALLSRQQGALASLRERITTGVLHDILQLHSPILSNELCSLMGEKLSRVWFTLDQLVSAGEPIPPEEWVKRLEDRMADLDVETRSLLSKTGQTCSAVC